LDQQIPRLQAELDFLRIQSLSRHEIVAQAQDLYGRWVDLLADEKRHIVENVVERITIGKGEVSIDVAYIPARSEITAKRQRGDRASAPALPAHAHVLPRQVEDLLRTSSSFWPVAVDP
jgi:site-specific DNA recombinase